MATHMKWIVLATLGLGIALGYLAARLQPEVTPIQAAQPIKPASKEPTAKAVIPRGKKPNIVFIMADNLGYGEPGCYGGGILRGAPTPRIDKLATQGIRLLNYSVESQCNPSRSAIMTGRFAMRSGTMRVNRGGGPYGLTQWEITLAELLSAMGYATGHFGKWHLGNIDGRYPIDQGFDVWYGIPNSTSVSPWTASTGFDPKVAPVPHIMEGKKGEKSRNLEVYDLKQRRLIDTEITKRSIDFIKKNAEGGKPFYAYVPFTLVHYPTLPHPDFAGKTGNGEFADSLAEMDHQIGRAHV